jgi:hypothetical protein
MQTEIERISTEQQRQGVELSGLRNDVQRGNRITEKKQCNALKDDATFISKVLLMDLNDQL